MRDAANIAAVSGLGPDYMGFIFYERSPRYAPALDLSALSPTVRRVGVFVDAPLTEILSTAERYGLDALQLHGAEAPETCQTLRGRGYEVIKAFGIESAEDFARTALYEDSCDLFLFDTRTPNHGGSGRRFDWRTLGAYNGNVPFLLSGGITEADTEELLTVNHPLFYGVDLNSRFEVSPGVKDVEKLERFIKNLQK